ncbi:MAG: UDP-N-acetylmuramate--L-alanine ligase [Acidobacteria bacterium]|jgi:UDP-N-acetylmuramate--alanine ligase|nr:UDP-N-acetylmuramate--L-alanine ligase [Acidobacteriota bacterium]
MRLSSLNKVHFVGIGGIGMSGIAEVLLTMGFSVTGSDVRENAVTEALKSHGAKISLGHFASNVHGAKVVVYSSAVSPENPELQEARHLGIPVIPRAEMLAELMRMKLSVAVSGSHGKTTVTAMIAHCSHEAGLDPTVVIGGRLSTLKASARLGKSDLLVAEADESDRSFLLLFPTMAVITNIDWEHVDCYPDIKDLQDAFLDFANRVPFYGAIVACKDDPNLQPLLPKFRRRVVTYGVSESADYRAIPLSSGPQGERFKVSVRGEERGEIRLAQVGRHVLLNATAAVAACEELGIPFAQIAGSLACFPGADRRFELKGEAAKVRVVDDYGHHPTEIRATLEAARKVAGPGRVVVLFQPHRYTRLKALMDDFARVFQAADVVVITEVYAASEPPIEGVTGEELASRTAALGHSNVHYCPAVQAIPVFARPLLRGGDLVITLGAGTITTAGEPLLSLLEEEGPGG